MSPFEQCQRELKSVTRLTYLRQTVTAVIASFYGTREQSGIHQASNMFHRLEHKHCQENGKYEAYINMEEGLCDLDGDVIFVCQFSSALGKEQIYFPIYFSLQTLYKGTY